jgi:hypothetical protein
LKVLGGNWADNFILSRRKVLVRPVHLQDLPLGIESASHDPPTGAQRFAGNPRRGMERLSLLSNSHHGENLRKNLINFPGKTLPLSPPKTHRQIQFPSQNPKWMKEKFSLVIETLHADDNGERENVSNRRRILLIVVFSFLFLLSFCARFFYVNQNPNKNTQKTLITLETV